jgi:predicted dehydrogenase
VALRVGVVGAGAMAEYHAKRFAGIPGVAITAVCDHVPDRAEAFAAARGIGRHFSDPAEMAASGEIDAMSVASYDGAHRAPALAALERGLPVFCEKPMARRLADAEDMAAAARRSGAPSIVNFSKRNGGLLDLASRLAAEGRLGAPLRLELSYLQSWILQDSWGDWRTTYRWKWRLLESQSTYGALGDLGSHLLDAALVLGRARAIGDPRDRLEARSCSATRFVPGPGDGLGGRGSFEEFRARFALGPLEISVEAGWRSPGRIDDFSAAIVCEGGRIEVDPGRSRSSVAVAGTFGERIEVEAGPFASTYERFVALATGRSIPEPGRDPDFNRGLEVQRAIRDCALLAGADPE